MMHRMTALAVTALALAACNDTRETTAPTADLAAPAPSSPGAVYAMTNEALPPGGAAIGLAAK